MANAFNSSEKHHLIRNCWLASKLCPSDAMGNMVAKILSRGDLDEYMIQEGLKALSTQKMRPGNHESLFVKFLMHKNTTIRKMAILSLTLCPKTQHWLLMIFAQAYQTAGKA